MSRADEVATLTRVDQVLTVLAAGGRIQGVGLRGLRELRDAQGRTVPAWQNALTAAERIHSAKGGDRKEHSMQVLNLALRIADRAVRSDVELYATEIRADDGTPMYRVEVPDAVGADEMQRCFLVIHEALLYIELRGDAFTWQMHKSVHGNLVWFVDKEPK